MKYHHLYIGLSLLACFSCGDSDDELSPCEPADLTKQIMICADQVYQTIDGFAASDCWVPNYVGQHWPGEIKGGVARLLFSSSVIAGAPQGIGLSMWRFNLGGGTADQGIDSDIVDKARRAECFLQKDGTLDWTRQQGQQYFLQKAKEYGCKTFVMFSNTPPIYYTRNGKGYSGMGGYSNLKEDCYDCFAHYMADVAVYFKEQKGINFSLISPVNEPQYNWDTPSQEGSGWQNKEIKRLTLALDEALTEKRLDTKILLAEAADWEYLYKVKGEATRSNVIANFFDPTSVNYAGYLKHVLQAIGGHSYWTDGSWRTMQEVRAQVATAAKARGLKVYQTEWSMLGDGYTENYPGHDKASYMDIALYMSKVIYQDLTVANVSSWSYWTGVDLERWGHKNRFLLVKVTPSAGDYGDVESGGTYEATKSLWVLGNYSLFIRPGYQRIGLSIANASSQFFGSAYLSPEKDKIVVVYTNLSTKSIGLNTTIQGLGKEVTTVKRYITSQTENLQEDIINNDRCTIQPNTVVTLVYQLN